MPAFALQLSRVACGTCLSHSQEVKLPVVSKPACSRQWSYAGAARTLLTDGQVCAGAGGEQLLRTSEAAGCLFREPCS